MTPIQIATLKHVAAMRGFRGVAGRRQSVDLRTISEPMRQKIIDLGMMSPPLVKVDGDEVMLTFFGHVEMARLNKT